MNFLRSSTVEFDSVYPVCSSPCVIEVNAVIRVDKYRWIEHTPIRPAAAGVALPLEPPAVFVQEVAEEFERSQRIAASEETDVVPGYVHVPFTRNCGGSTDPAAFRDRHLVILSVNQVAG